jgi:thiol-disulfide isomerase/thioredoxin
MAKKVIKFWAGFCGPCKVYAPTFEKVKQELEGDIEFQEVNVEEDTEGLAAEYKVRGIPLTVLLEDGVKVKEQTGRLGEQQLRDFILN